MICNFQTKKLESPSLVIDLGKREIVRIVLDSAIDSFDTKLDLQGKKKK